MPEQLLGGLVLFFYALLAAAPIICLVLLGRHYLRGVRLPAAAVWAVYAGCLVWIPILAWRAALNEAWRPWIAAPAVVGFFLSLIWQRRATPAVGSGWAFLNSAAFAAMALMGWAALGGGYFDKLFQVPHAQKMVRQAGVSPDDPVALAQALRDGDLWVRWGAALELQRLGPAAAPALDALAAAVEDSDARVNRQAWNVIRGLGPLAAPAAPALAALLKKDQNDWEALEFFRSLGSQAKDSVPALLTLLEDPSPAVRIRALRALGSIGPPAKEETLPALVRLQETEKDDNVRREAGETREKLKIEP